MKRKKLNKDERYEQSKYYAEKRDAMEASGYVFGIIGMFLILPLLIVLTMLGMPEHDAKNWACSTMAPGVICGLLYMYFSFRSWLADPYKNI